ncbi:MAG: DUF4382 domain-containing protein, partial [Longimicrobiales bacterium]|nr:DUF4382 domain-containing protein [Longimicrobiales bacterium]
MLNRITKLAALTTAVVVGAVACEPNSSTAPGADDMGPDGPATLKVLLTDAPADYIDSAWVDIGRVDLVPADEDAEIITLTEDGTDGFVNLLDLQGDATAQLADTMIEAGTYSQLRLIVESARVALIDGYTFRDGTTSRALQVPSGAQTGIKLNLHGADGDENGEANGGVEIIPGETVLVVDFDVDRSYVIQGNAETPAGIRGVLFKPTLRVSVQDVAGSISGTVSGPDSVDVDGLTVTADPTGTGTVEGYQTETATALTAEDGTYTIHFLVPGEYEVSVAAPEGYFADPAMTTVNVGDAEDVTGVDFALDEAGSIAGTVTATDDSISVEALTVTAASTGDGPTLTGETDGDGNYTIAGVRPGEYEVTVDAGEGFFSTPESETVTVAVGEDVTGVDFEIDDAAGSIAGLVT